MTQPYHTHAAMNSRPAVPSLDGSLFTEPVLWKILLLLAIFYMVWSEKLSIVLDLSASSENPEQLQASGRKVKASLLPEFFAGTQAPKTEHSKVRVVMPPGSTGNVTLAIDPGYAVRNGLSNEALESALAACRDYVGRFAPVAVAEMHKFGIPASVILAQGLLESNAGDSPLARKANNHFGIKCFSRRCKAGHCVNFSDDSHKDFFAKYGNIWSSYRAHSQFLKKSKRYAQLFELDSRDYRGWALGLVKAGYATDKKYAAKIVALIQNLELDVFDQR